MAVLPAHLKEPAPIRSGESNVDDDGDDGDGDDVEVVMELQILLLAVTESLDVCC